VRYVESPQLQEVFVAGAARLARMRKEIDRLNVFPVPDGDTGTNMYMTFMAALQGMSEVSEESIGAVTEAMARGALRGARGNSGVILSQILQGFAAALAGKDQAGARDIAAALEKGVEFAYRALSEPVEGTMLTVARSAAEAARYAAERSADLRRLSLYTYRRAAETLALTPELLPVLKKAGVVDAGGQGFLVILEGMLQVFKRFRQEELLTVPLEFDRAETEPVPRLENLEDIKFLYCTEFLLRGPDLPAGEVRERLHDLGDCLMVVGNGDTLKVHIHSNNPGTVLEECLRYGTLHEIHINNMRDQHVEMKGPNKPLGVVSVVAGEGLAKIFESLGVDSIVNGQQTMNPSTEEILSAVERTPADQVIILPNNSNIILAAQQVQALSRKEVRVLPTRTIPQGLAAMLAFLPDADLQTNTSKMEAAHTAVLTGEVTRAVRDAEIDGLTVVEGDYIGLAEGQLVKSGTLVEVTENVISRLITGGELVTLYHGQEVSRPEAEEMLARFQSAFPEVDFELYYGGQPLYHFIISVE
jgi:hypothetical protein